MVEPKTPSIFSWDGCLLAILSILAGGGAVAVGILLDERLQPTNGFEKLLKVIVVDFFFTTAAVFALTLIMLIFRPAWLNKFLRTTVQKFFLVFGLMVFGFLVIGLYIFFVEGNK